MTNLQNERIYKQGIKHMSLFYKDMNLFHEDIAKARIKDESTQRAFLKKVLPRNILKKIGSNYDNTDDFTTQEADVMYREILQRCQYNFKRISGVTEV